MKRCLICDSVLHPFLSFGKMPIANGFLTPDQFEAEYFFELEVGFCGECTMVQLLEQPDRERMFHQNYAFFSSTSTRMASHFEKFARLVSTEYLKSPDPFVVEIGSNDGIMLQNLSKAGIRHLGIEPSANVAKAAAGKGVQTISEFFDEELARRICGSYGQADAILAANVMCHIPYLHSVAAGIQCLLKPDGIFTFEDPYLGDIIEKTAYDQIYDEHAFYFSLSAIKSLFDRYGLEVIDVMPQQVHGGSMRYVLAHAGKRAISERVTQQMAWEKGKGLHELVTFERFRLNVQNSRDSLVRTLREKKEQGKRIVGYGATSKSTTVVNYCGIGPELIDFISDTTPIKQGKYSPGVHIPVRPYQEFKDHYPHYALLFAWNHAEEIFGKERNFQHSGGKWILYVPEVRVVS